MKIILTILVALSLTSVARAAGVDMDGWVSDSLCGAKHMGVSMACVKKCIAGGKLPVFVDEKKQVWSIDNPEVINNFMLVSKEVTITAVVNKAHKSVRISSIKEKKG